MKRLQTNSSRRARRVSRLAAGGIAATMLGAVAQVGTAEPASAATSIVIRGGDTNAEVVCGNVAEAVTFARRRRGARLQRSNCTARADGGSATLSDVDIYLSAEQADRAIDDLVQNRDRQQRDLCDRQRRSPGRGFQLNICSGTGRSGAINLQNVRQVFHGPDGHTSTRRILSESGPPRRIPDVAAECANVRPPGANQQDDCTGSGDGSSWEVHGVDVESTGPDGNRTMQRGISVVLRGGNANATIHCFNTTDGSGRVFQINRCGAVAVAGSLTLRNVTFHVGSF